MKDNKKILFAWASYDWANSVYNLLITTAIFPIYFSSVTSIAFHGDEIPIGSTSLKSSVLYTFVLSLSYLIIVFLSPILSGIADAGGRKKMFMQLFTLLGAFSCISLMWFEGQNVFYGLSMAMLASIGYAGSLVFYNAFLPEIASDEQMDKTSAQGFMMGYAGSLILLIFSLMMISNPANFGLPDTKSATQMCFLMVGVWWILFSRYFFMVVPEQSKTIQAKTNIWTKGLEELKLVWTQIQSIPDCKYFLFAFFFWSMGVQTVMLLAPLFGESELHLASDELIMVVIIVQVLAIFGAWLFSFISKKIKNINTLMIAVILWSMICIAAFYVQNKNEFYILAAILGVIMGGIQSLSRSTYAKLIPSQATETASFFSFYDVSEKLAIVIGTFSYGFIEEWTGSKRNSSLAMIVFFIIGLFFLVQMKKIKSHKGSV